MRVPVYPQDLAHNRGFKSLAKRFWRQWCVSKSISLELAQEILANGFGYRDFYDLRQESIWWPNDAPIPLEADIRYGIVSAAKAVIKPEESLSADQVELERVVAALPLTVLRALKYQRAVQLESSQTTFTAPNLKPQNYALTSELVLPTANSVITPRNIGNDALLLSLISGLRSERCAWIKVSMGHFSPNPTLSYLNLENLKSLN